MNNPDTSAAATPPSNCPEPRRLADASGSLPVAETLNKFPEVVWDRFGGDGIEHAGVFGWIERPDGKHDFAAVLIGTEGAWCMITSSARYSAEFSARLGMSTHSDCRRVEDHFPGVRCVRLKEENTKPSGSRGDGGTDPS